MLEVFLVSAYDIARDSGIELLPPTVHISAGSLPSSPDDFPYLSRIDPYGDTVFNYLQMIPFLDEWRRIPRDGLHADYVRDLDRVRELAERCLAHQQGMLLVFEGD